MSQVGPRGDNILVCYVKKNSQRFAMTFTSTLKRDIKDGAVIIYRTFKRVVTRKKNNSKRSFIWQKIRKDNYKGCYILIKKPIYTPF